MSFASIKSLWHLYVNSAKHSRDQFNFIKIKASLGLIIESRIGRDEKKRIEPVKG